VVSFICVREADKESRCSASKPWIYAAILYLDFTNVIVLILSVRNPSCPSIQSPTHFQLDSFHPLIPRFFKTKIYIFSLFKVTDFSGYLKWNTMSSTVLFPPIIVTKWWPSPRSRPRPAGLGTYNAFLSPFHSTANSFSACSSCGFLVQTQMHHEVSHHRRMSGVLRRNPHELRRRQRTEVKVINITFLIVVI
jgi:hypothetical protein